MLFSRPVNPGVWKVRSATYLLKPCDNPALLQIMRILLNVSIPHEQFNAAVRDGSIGSKLRRILDESKPEAVYFTEQHGKRSCLLIVDLPDATKIPALAEPWFLTFNADVELKFVMTPSDLANAGLDDLGKKWSHLP